MPIRVNARWRPQLGTVLLVVLGLVLCLPIAGLFLFRFYANQLVQQTEESLLTQASVLSAVYAELYSEHSGVPARQTPSQVSFAPVFPSLSLGSDSILPPRQDARAMIESPEQIYAEIGPELSRIAQAAQVNTLVGYRLLDKNGNVIGGTAELAMSLAHVDEVARALDGKTTSVARVRVRPSPEPAVYWFSLGARVRVFVAVPVFVSDELVGAVYLSRTPNHIFRFLYGERFNLAKAGLFILGSTALIGFVFWRFVTRPIKSLTRRTRVAAAGGGRWQAPDYLGTREIENLSQSFQTLTQRLETQQDMLRTYTAHVTHELKSPLTAIKGAAELLRDPAMTGIQRDRFLDNVDSDIARMDELLASMRAFTVAGQHAHPGTASLGQVAPDVRSGFPGLRILLEQQDVILPLSAEAMKIVLTHMLENAEQSGADQVELTAAQDAAGVTIAVQDNGRGISTGNLAKVMTPFFTTRRQQGGTGMGLSIVKSVVEASGGQISVESNGTHTRFVIRFGHPTA